MRRGVRDGSRFSRAFLAAVLAGIAGVALVAAAGVGAQDRVVLTIGLKNDVDSLNPLVGVEVPDYEVWNMQYATLTDKAAADFATVPGLAESWQESDDGKTFTYTLREGLRWSDGRPLTAEDIAYTVNRARDEEWLNHASTVANLEAKAVDERTVEITTRVPDPKLPTMDVYILPKHIWEKQDAKAITKYDGLDGVGSGPFVLAELKRGQFWRMVANDNYWGGRPAVDEVVFRLFTNEDAMVAALKRGEIDAAHDVPAQAFADLDAAEGIVAIVGEQGGFSEVSVNGGRPEEHRVDGIGNGHPALSDIRVRQAIAHAIDKQTLVDRVEVGLARPGAAISPSANPGWIPEIPAEEQFGFDLARARQLLDEAGLTDSDGNGIREHEGKDVVLTYLVRTESVSAAKNAEFVSGWLEQIGLGTRLRTVSDSRLTEDIGKGAYDLFEWGWVPFVDPDPMLSYFTCDQLSKDPENPTDYYNDANTCSSAYDADYQAQKVELDPEKRLEIVHRMLRTFYDAATYNVLYYDGDLQAYRTDRFEGWVRQPAETGPVLFSNSSPSYVALRPVGASGAGDGGGIGTGAVIGIVAAAVLVLGAGGFVVVRRRSAEDRE